jgi:tetrahydromethanopterin S-methyltransferase subunit E
MKKTILFIAIIGISTAAFAQKKEDDFQKLQFSVGVEAALPLGDFGKSSTFGIGGTAQADYKVTDDLGLNINAGYISFLPKSITVLGVTSKGKAVGYIPILGGIRYYFSEEVFALAQLGVTIATASGNSTSLFTYAPGIGYKFSNNVDAALKYTGYSKNSINSSTIGLRVAYTF